MQPRVDPALRGRDRRLHARVLAARLAVRPAYRRTDRSSRHRAGGDLPRRGPRRGHLRIDDTEQWSYAVSTLEIHDLQVSVKLPAGQNGQPSLKPILAGVDLTVKAGETHAIMGPNGSGKSTLAYSIAGHPKYQITGGTVTLDGADVLAMSVDERARAGLFLAMQYPVEVPGVSVANFL